MNSGTYDVFVSYTHEDMDWVRTVLVQRLAAHGLSVFIDYIDFKTGALSPVEMERGVLNSKHTLAVLTPGYVASAWCIFESVMAQCLDPAAEARRIIPILRRDCDIPLRLRILHYRDLRRDQEEQWQLLIRDLV